MSSKQVITKLYTKLYITSKQAQFDYLYLSFVWICVDIRTDTTYRMCVKIVRLRLIVAKESKNFF